MKTALIIGGGFSGCSAAHTLAARGDWDITLVEAAPFLGGGCKTLYYGGHPYTFGPRHFLTQNRAIHDYLNGICPLRSCKDHVFQTYIEPDQAFYGYPIHMDDIQRMPDRDKINAELAASKGAADAKNLKDFWVMSVGETLYKKFVDKYSKKMWMLDDNAKIDHFGWSPKGVTIKEGAREAWDTAISAYPYARDGYDHYFDVATADVKVMLKTRIEAFDIPNKTVVIDGERHSYDVIVNTISPDILFEFCHGELPYVGRDLLKIVLPVEHSFPENTYFLYYANDEKFTRIVEYKKFTKHEAPTTLLGLEMPSTNGRYYPLPINSIKALANEYFKEMPDGVYSIGRAGSYLYEIDIDDAIEQSWETIKLIR